MRTISQAGISLIQSFEGLRTTAYKDQRGFWTNGWGHKGPDVHEGQVVTDEQAGLWLADDLENTERVVDATIPQEAPQCQFDACTSLAFNIGTHAFRTSILVKLLNSGDRIGAAAQFLDWSHVNGVIDKGLMNRRVAEREMFMRVTPL